MCRTEPEGGHQDHSRGQAEPEGKRRNYACRKKRACQCHREDHNGSFPKKNAGSDEYMEMQMLIQEDVIFCVTPRLDDPPNRPLEVANFVDICGYDQQNRLGGLPLPPPPTALAAEALQKPGFLKFLQESPREPEEGPRRAPRKPHQS